MCRLIFTALLLIAGQATAGEQVISVQHDSVRGVTCWILNNTGISCLPDSSLMRTPASSTRSEDQAGQASVPSTMSRTATPLLLDERFQL